MIDIDQYIHSRTELNLKLQGDRYRGWCPFQGPSGQYECFSLHAETGQWICRSSRCGLRGGFPLFIKLLEGGSWADVMARVGSRYPRLREDADLLAITKPPRPKEEARQPLPIDAEFITPASWPAYMSVKRHYGPELIQSGFAFARSPDRKWKDRLLIPIYDASGEMTTFTGRAMDDVTEPRYRHPSGSQMGRWLFGVHRIPLYDRIDNLLIVEGQFDVFRFASYGLPVLGLSGNQASAPQLMGIRAICNLYGCRPIIALDLKADLAIRKLHGDLVALGTNPGTINVGKYAKDPDTMSLDSLQLAFADLDRQTFSF